MDTIEIITIPVRDQQESKAFYQNIGFEVVVEAPMGKDSHWIQMKLPGATPSISLVKSFPYPEIAMEPGALQGLVLKTHDMERLCEKAGGAQHPLWRFNGERFSARGNFPNGLGAIHPFQRPGWQWVKCAPGIIQPWGNWSLIGQVPRPVLPCPDPMFNFPMLLYVPG